MDIIKVGKFIASLRKEKWLTQQELGDKLFVTNKAVSKWETEVCIPDLALYESLCSTLGITINELLLGTYLTKEDYTIIFITRYQTIMDNLIGEKHYNITGYDLNNKRSF